MYLDVGCHCEIASSGGAAQLQLLGEETSSTEDQCGHNTGVVSPAVLLLCDQRG